MATWIYYGLLILLFLSFHEAVELHMQIVAPERDTQIGTNSAINRGKSIANRDLSRRARDEGIYLETSIFYMDKLNPSPGSLTELFCNETFVKNSSVLMSINYNKYTSVATEYIINVALEMGYPVISWDPFYTGALEVSTYSRIIHGFIKQKYSYAYERKFPIREKTHCLVYAVRLFI